MPKWQAVGWLMFFISGLILCIWVLFYMPEPDPKPDRVDCKTSQSQFATAIGEAVLSNSFGRNDEANSYEQIAARIVLTSPICYSQQLIEQAQITYGQ